MTHDSSPTIIDLGKHRTAGVRVFSGRKRGEGVRKSLRVDELDSQPDEVVVKIPEDTFTVTSSFFLGLFGDSIQRLGEKQFREKYRFDGPAMETIEDSIRYAARAISPLQKPSG